MDDIKIAEECAKRALDELEKTTAVRIKLNDGKTDIFSSKFGGIPYIPHDAAPPLSNYKYCDVKQRSYACLHKLIQRGKTPDPARIRSFAVLDSRGRLLGTSR